MTTNVAHDDPILQRLQRQIMWFRAIAVLALLGVIALAIAWFASIHTNRDHILRTQGIVVTDAQGHERILIGAPAIATVKSTSAYGDTNSIVFLNRNGTYHLALGQAPAPVVNGKAPLVNGKPIKRIGNGDDYGVALYDSHGSERGGMVFLGGASRAVIALDRAWPAQDAIGLMVDDKSGFAGMGINYANGNSGFEVGAKGEATSMTLSDPQGYERASLQIKGAEKPAWLFNGAPATSSAAKP
ncbi:MAG TPA: hypothetical protein VN630_11445 [Rhodanobacteraceae bacterium]|nr:hypothetical protein [Rhodanobacteraceae bacterium]